MLRTGHGRGFAEEVLEDTIEDLDDLLWVRLEELEDVDRHFKRNLLIKVARLELLLLLATADCVSRLELKAVKARLWKVGGRRREEKDTLLAVPTEALHQSMDLRKEVILSLILEIEPDQST